MNKKGQAEQFNWIFVIVAGAIILGFFVMFIFKYVELEERKQDVQTVRFFSTGVLSASSKLHVGSGGAAVDSQGEEGIRFGYNTRLGYLCTGEDASILINDGSTAWYKLKDEVVFMDKTIDFGALDGVDLWILPWNYPFHVSNFVYLANSKTKFYIVHDNAGMETIDDLDISSVFNVEIVPESELERIESNSKVVFLTARAPSNINSLSRGRSAGFVHINNREARFFEDGQWSEAVEFYSTEQLYGAIFSNDAGNFECNIRRSMERAKTLANVYSERTRLLSQMDRREGCNYATAVNLLNQYASGNLELGQALEESNVGLGGGCLWVY